MSETLTESSLDTDYGQRRMPFKFIDRSFTNLGYIGYNEGIQLNDLDNEANWQFN